MIRRQHPAERARERVADTIVTTEWWEAERAQARRDEAMARLLNTLSWCCVGLACAAVVGILVTSYRSL